MSFQQKSDDSTYRNSTKKMYILCKIAPQFISIYDIMLKFIDTN